MSEPAFREGGGDSVREALQPVNNGNQSVLNAPAFQFVHHRKPELRSFILRNPEPKALAQAITGDAKGDV